MNRVPLHLAWDDRGSSVCGISYTAHPRVTSVAIETTCLECLRRIEQGLSQGCPAGHDAERKRDAARTGG
jgi:hypothetical protein